MGEDRGQLDSESGRGAGQACAGAQRTEWRELLAGRSPREILARIVPGDPLALRGIVAERLAARRLLLDADRLLLSAMARTARFAARYRGRPSLDQWLGQRVDEAIDDSLREEQRAALELGGAGAEGVYADLAGPLGIDPERARAACSALNELPLEERRAFFLFVLERRSLEECVRLEGVSASEVGRRARRVLEALMATGVVPEEPQ